MTFKILYQCSTHAQTLDMNTLGQSLPSWTSCRLGQNLEKIADLPYFFGYNPIASVCYASKPYLISLK
jgi:hypothetical protein